MEFDNFFKKKPSRKKKRLIRCYLYLSHEEMKQLKKQAESTGLPVSKYVRTRCLYADDPSLKKNPVDFIRLASAINRVGVNLNQLVKHYNTWGLSEKDVQALKQFHQHTQDILKELIKSF